MSERRRGVFVNNEEKRYLFVSKPLAVYFFLTFAFLGLIYFIFATSAGNIKSSEASPIFKDKNIFSHLNKLRDTSYTIRSRESLDRSNIHRVFFQVDVPKGTNQEQLLAVAQKIVKETISHEYCHSIKIDFGPYGYVDFAPYGNWAKGGEVPISHYRNYRFNYVLSSSFFSIKNGS